MPRKPNPVAVAEPRFVVTGNPLAVTIKEAAALLSTSEKTMYSLSRRPGFPKISIGNKAIIPVAALQHWLEENIGSTLTIEREWCSIGSRAVFTGHIIKALETKLDCNGNPCLNFSVKDEETGAFFPCFAIGNAAVSVARKAQVDQPMLWICDISAQPNMLTEGKTTRVTFRVISWMPL